MPEIISDDFAIKLSKTHSNTIETLAFFQQKPTDLIIPNQIIPPCYRLLESKVKKHHEGKTKTVCLIYKSGEEVRTIYKLTLLMRDNANVYTNQKNCTQLLVWRDLNGEHSTVLNGFAKTMFDYLLETYAIIITDDQQTQDGRRFWLNRMSESLTMVSRTVSFMDFDVLDEDKNLIKTNITSNDELMDYVNRAWGNSQKYRDKVFLIDKKEAQKY